MPHQKIFELCADSLQSCLAAGRGGAHRIELCTSLEVGGLTPDATLIGAACSKSGLPVHVLLRPSVSSSQFSAEIFSSIARMIPVVRSLGGAGVVLGLLKPDGNVDIEHTRELVELASPLPVTFHRAFDETPDLAQALEDVIAAGCARVLTSGGELNAVAGATRLAALVEQSAGRIDVAVAGGLRLNNVREVAHTSRADHYHASLKETAEESVSNDALKARIEDIVKALCLPDTLLVEKIG